MDNGANGAGQGEEGPIRPEVQMESATKTTPPAAKDSWPKQRGVGKDLPAATPPSSEPTPPGEVDARPSDVSVRDGVPREAAEHAATAPPVEGVDVGEKKGDSRAEATAAAVNEGASSHSEPPFCGTGGKEWKYGERQKRRQ